MRGGWFGVLLGLCVAIWGVATWIRGAQAARWPVTAGQLSSAELARSEHTSYDDKGRSTDSETYSAEVRYTYSVAGRPYYGTRYQLVDWSTSFHGRELWKVNRVRQEQAARGRIDVHYNPRRPQDSALDVRLGAEGLIGLNVGLLILCGCLGGISGGSSSIRLHTLAGGALVAVVAIGAPCFFFGLGVNWFLIVVWILCLTLPFVIKPKPFRSGRRLR